MHDVFTRLYRTKVILSCLVLVATGITLLAVDRNQEGDITWMGWMPWGELGGILVGAGILGVLVDAYLSREQAEIDEARTRRLFRKEAPAMVDAVIGAFAAGRDDLRRVATPELLDNLVTNSLALRLGRRAVRRRDLHRHPRPSHPGSRTLARRPTVDRAPAPNHG
jgi:hypothetical protein